jgi:deoxyribodipyrimidine photolyase-related protein
MVLGNFMLLCEIDPNEVYRWFMEMFIDAYDWVMVPNIYGMSQYADGGLMTTKPYISSSKYVLRMSDYAQGPWCKIWDGLYWRFIDKHRNVFRKIPRMSVMVSAFDRMPPEKRTVHISLADNFLNKL